MRFLVAVECCMRVRYLTGSHFPKGVGYGYDIRGLNIRTPFEVEIVVDL